MRRHAAGLVVTSALLACSVQPAPLLPRGKHYSSDTPLFPITIDGKTGFIDRSGRVVIPPRLDGGGAWLDFFEGVLVHGQELLDVRGRPIRHGRWALAGERSAEGFIRIRLPSGKMSHLQWRRKSVLPGQFDEAADFSDGLAAVKQSGKWGYIDRTGRAVIPPRFLRVDRFWNGLARVIEEGPCWIDPGDCTGNFVIGASEEWYRQAGLHPERPIHPKVPACRYILIDRTGAYVRDGQSGPAFSPGEPEYSQGVKRVRSDSPPGVWFVDESRNKLFGRAFAEATPFRHGLALVTEGGMYHYIDRTGRTVFSYPTPKPPVMWATPRIPK